MGATRCERPEIHLAARCEGDDAEPVARQFAQCRALTRIATGDDEFQAVGPFRRRGGAHDRGYVLSGFEVPKHESERVTTGRVRSN